MSYPAHVEIIYSGENGIDIDFDNFIEQILKGLGYECWASGFDLETEKRDIAFDLKNKNIPKDKKTKRRKNENTEYSA